MQIRVCVGRSTDRYSRIPHSGVPSLAEAEYQSRMKQHVTAFKFKIRPSEANRHG